MDVKLALLTEMWHGDDDVTQYWVPVLDVDMRKNTYLVLEENHLRVTSFLTDNGALAQVAVVDDELYQRLLDQNGKGTHLSKRVAEMLDPYREGL